jgi:HEPN domain-containing protein
MSAYEPDKYQGFLYAAYKDILAVESLCEFGNVHFEAIAFHAQQAAEKILKKRFS